MTEWAQLRSGQTTTEHLERGRWYLVQVRRTSGFVHVLGTDAAGVTLVADMVRIIDYAPDMVTRVQEGAGLPRNRPSGQTPVSAPYGVCPKGHRIDALGRAALDVRCPKCARTYRVEDENHRAEGG
jgi:hypothetical protein